MKINDFKDEELNFGILLILMPYCAYSKKEIMAQYGYKEIKKISRTRGCYSVEYYFNDLIEELYRKVTARYCYSMKIYKVDSESKWMFATLKSTTKNEIFSACIFWPNLRQY
jgi:hypothetical protein